MDQAAQFDAQREKDLILAQLKDIGFMLPALQRMALAHPNSQRPAQYFFLLEKEKKLIDRLGKIRTCRDHGRNGNGRGTVEVTSGSPTKKP